MLVTYQVEEVRNSHLAVSQKYEEDLLESLQAHDHQYGTGQTTAASPSSGKFGAVSVRSMHQHRENDRFPTKNNLLAALDGRHRCSCVQKRSTSEQPDTERAFQHTRMTLIKAFESKIPTDHELIQLSSFANMLPGLVFQTQV